MTLNASLLDMISTLWWLKLQIKKRDVYKKQYTRYKLYLIFSEVVNYTSKANKPLLHLFLNFILAYKKYYTINYSLWGRWTRVAKRNPSTSIQSCMPWMSKIMDSGQVLSNYTLKLVFDGSPINLWGP
jgi:hypothetical protein